MCHRKKSFWLVTFVTNKTGFARSPAALGAFLVAHFIYFHASEPIKYYALCLEGNYSFKIKLFLHSNLCIGLSVCQ